MRCSIPIVSENAIVIIKVEEDLFPGGNVEIGCREGFTAKGSTILTCLPNRTWRGTRPLCEGICLFPQTEKYKKLILTET